MIITVSSLGGRIGTPLYSLYQSTKFALEGFIESLYFELNQFNIRLKIVEPGGIKTEFINRQHNLKSTNLKKYPLYTEKVQKKLHNFTQSYGVTPEYAAKRIYKTALSNNRRLRYTIGSDTKLLLLLNKILPYRIFRKIVQFMIE